MVTFSPPARRRRSLVLPVALVATTIPLAVITELGLQLLGAAAARVTNAAQLGGTLVVCSAVMAVVLAGAAVRLFRQTSQLDRIHAELADMAATDNLTGLANRRAFEHELERHCRLGSDLALMLIDLDDLKDVNDSLGHSVGDAVLQTAAQRILSCVRTSDTVARLSGDEFAVLLPRVGDLANAEIIARRIVEAIQTPLGPEHHNSSVGASLGLVMAESETHAALLFRNADVALYAAKKEGKGRHIVYRDDMHATESERIQYEQELRTALQRDQFILHYQPIVDSRTRRILGAEALVRWLHPVRGLVPPLDFIPLAESTGLIVPIGAWVLRQACIQAQQWRRSDPLLADFVLSVNVSARQLLGTQLEADVIAALNESGLDPKCLILEIIESQMMADIGHALRQMASLKQLGVRIAIDDFGTGYSSLGYLHEFPVDFLKLDKSFTDNITDSIKSQELMRTVAQLSRTLSISTVAEGVETGEQAAVLDSLDVNLCQGYFFARPIAAEAMAQLLQRVVHLPEAVAADVSSVAPAPARHVPALTLGAPSGSPAASHPV